MIIKSRFTRYIYISPFLVLLFCFMLIPFLVNIILSFTNYKAIISEIEFIGVKNYVLLLGDPKIWDSIIITLYYVVGVMIVTMLLGVFYAFVMNLKIYGTSILKAIILLPWIIPETITANIWKWLFTADSGYIYNLLLKFHIITEGTSFFMNPKLALFLVIFVNSWRTAPFVAVMVYAKLKAIPASQLEAASIDGANNMQIFCYITVPWIYPILSRCSLLLFIWGFNSFTIIYTLTFGGPLSATTTLPFLIRQIGFDQYNFGQASALSVITLIILVTIAVMGQLISKSVVRLFGKRRLAK